MKAELWEGLGKALIDNAELLEQLMLADAGVPVAGKPKMAYVAFGATTHHRRRGRSPSVW